MLNQQSMTASTMQNNNETFSELEEQFVETVKNINEMTIAQLNTSVARLKLILTQLQKDREKFTEDDEKLMIGELLLWRRSGEKRRRSAGKDVVLSFNKTL